MLATADRDWLFHHGTTCNSRGESYRIKVKSRTGLLGQAPQRELEEVTTTD
jgi:hypothetical protein